MIGDFGRFEVLQHSRAITKVQSILLITVVAVAAVAGSVAYVIFSSNLQATQEPIRIGICADLDATTGKSIWRGATLAAEEINDAGGVLGKNFTIVAEDDDSETAANVDTSVNAMTRLITVDKADFVVSSAATSTYFFPLESICAQNKKIMFTVAANLDNFSQQVLDDYNNYKFVFKFLATNTTTIANNILDYTLAIGNYSGFTKIGLFGQDTTILKAITTKLNSELPTKGFQIVYNGKCPGATTDFTSYFSAIEASGAQMLVVFLYYQQSVPFVKEWFDRQSPVIMLGLLAGTSDPVFWDSTGGKCECISTMNSPVISGYNLTNKSAATRDAYLKRWGTNLPNTMAAAVYDGVRFILPEAIKRAGTIETDSVIKTLETLDVETSLARHFIYTKAHDIMMSRIGSTIPPEEYQLNALVQWQANKTLVPVVPETLMKEAGYTYEYPPWKGPWSNKQTP